MFTVLFSKMASLNCWQQGKDEKNVVCVKKVYKIIKKDFIIMKTLKSF